MFSFPVRERLLEWIPCVDSLISRDNSKKKKQLRVLISLLSTVKLLILGKCYPKKHLILFCFFYTLDGEKK